MLDGTHKQTTWHLIVRMTSDILRTARIDNACIPNVPVGQQPPFVSAAHPFNTRPCAFARFVRFDQRPFIPTFFVVQTQRGSLCSCAMTRYLYSDCRRHRHQDIPGLGERRVRLLQRRQGEGAPITTITHAIATITHAIVTLLVVILSDTIIKVVVGSSSRGVGGKK